MRAAPYSTEAFDQIPDLRDVAKRAGGDGVLIGGPTAEERDLRQSAARDTRVIVPIVLLVVFLVLAALLRALVLPLILIGTVVLSFLAALGVGAFFFEFVFDFPGSDPSLPLWAFVFLVALGIDYNIFLMARVREEALRHGTRPGMVRGLAVTGGVITSAGIVLAGTFSILAIAAARVPDGARLRDRLRRAARHLPRALPAGAGARVRHRSEGVVAVHSCTGDRPPPIRSPRRRTSARVRGAPGCCPYAPSRLRSHPTSTTSPASGARGTSVVTLIRMPSANPVTPPSRSRPCLMSHRGAHDIPLPPQQAFP